MKEMRDNVEKIIVKRVNKDGYIYWKNGMVMVDDILSLINQEVIKGRISVHRQYIKECPMGFELYAEEQIEQLKEELNNVTPKERG